MQERLGWTGLDWTHHSIVLYTPSAHLHLYLPYTFSHDHISFVSWKFFRITPPRKAGLESPIFAIELEARQTNLVPVGT
jgi:hypothetical protein